jgi:flavin reductase (DIM6/NTAB) family NADH-FMN oxidoreductase RutF
VGHHFYRPSEGHRLPHDPFNAIVAPRPIGWVSTLSAEGVRNLAPYSFFNAFNYKPPIIGFASNGWKHSVSNIAATSEFTWNLVTRPQAEAMNATSATVAPDVDEFDLAGITGQPSIEVRRTGWPALRRPSSACSPSRSGCRPETDSRSTPG